MFRKKNFLLLLILVFLICILIFLTDVVYASYLNKLNLENSATKISENNENQVFSINKIVYFSSSSAKTDISNSNLIIENLFQYTDIAIYINNSSDAFTAENTLKSVYIDNINFTNSPQIGTPSLYYKNINDFATDTFLDDNKIDDSIFFDITSENSLDFSEAILYNNCANPITLSYINNNIKTNYTLSNLDTPITYDGSLLKRSNILLNSISCSISFNIHIINNLDEQFVCPIYIDIPLDNDDTSIYDGSYTLIDNTNYVFFKY